MDKAQLEFDFESVPEERETHNRKFARLQDDYLRTGDKSLLGSMYRLCAEIAGNYIRKYEAKHGLRLDTQTLAHDSAVYVIDQYLRRPAFKVQRISAYIYFGCMKSLYKDKKREQREVSFEEIYLQ
jgi:hypothetical protein